MSPYPHLQWKESTSWPSLLGRLLGRALARHCLSFQSQTHKQTSSWTACLFLDTRDLPHELWKQGRRLAVRLSHSAGTGWLIVGVGSCLGRQNCGARKFQMFLFFLFFFSGGFCEAFSALCAMKAYYAFVSVKLNPYYKSREREGHPMGWTTKNIFHSQASPWVSVSRFPWQPAPSTYMRAETMFFSGVHARLRPSPCSTNRHETTIKAKHSTSLRTHEVASSFETKAKGLQGKDRPERHWNWTWRWQCLSAANLFFTLSPEV